MARRTPGQPDTSRVALIAGAGGVVGRRLALQLAGRPGWRVIGLSRRGGDSDLDSAGVESLALDLRDGEACRAVARRLDGVTHLFNAARFDHDTRTLESPHTNTQMLANILDALVESRQPLQHVHLVHGTKYYGSHLGPIRTPARESDPRSLQDNFYYHQEDLVRTRHASEGWSFSTSRPHAVIDSLAPAARSIPMVIAVYAAVCRELGLPLSFPGTRENYCALYQFTEAGLLARAIEWMATEGVARNNAYNVTNGDFVRWCDLWPVLARDFGMEPGPVRTVRLAEVMPGRGDVWARIVRKHGLVETPYEQAALWTYGDFVLTSGWDIVTSATKARQHGFHEVIDSESMLLDTFERLRRRRIIPPR